MGVTSFINLPCEMWLRILKVSAPLSFKIGKIIVKIGSRTRSFCPCHYVQNGLSYPGEETRPKLCLKGRQANFGVSSLGTNKDQLLHRIQSVRTFTNLQ